MEAKEIAEELRKILVRCETKQEYHQAIIELKIDVDKEKELKILASSESYGSNHGCHAKMLLKSNLFDELSEDKQSKIGFEAGRFIEQIRTTIELAHAKENKQEERQENINTMIGLFHTAGFDMIWSTVFDNQYSSHPVYYTSPWLEVITSKGPITIGWRKRVISIDWSKSDIKKTAEEMFPDETSTKYDNLIHAWGYDKAIEYLTKLNSEG